MRKAILCFIRKEDEVLLIYDQYPSGAVWNGISGYIESEESPKDAVIREIKEEVGLDVKEDALTYLGTESAFQVFETYIWSGIPQALEHGIMELKWFKVSEMSYDKMHKGNDLWLPKLLI